MSKENEQFNPYKEIGELEHTDQTERKYLKAFELDKVKMSKECEEIGHDQAHYHNYPPKKTQYYDLNSSKIQN